MLDPKAGCPPEDVFGRGLPSTVETDVPELNYIDVLGTVPYVGSASDCVVFSVGDAWLRSANAQFLKESFRAPGNGVVCSTLHRVVWQNQLEPRHSIPFLVDIHRMKCDDSTMESHTS